METTRERQAGQPAQSMMGRRTPSADPLPASCSHVLVPLGSATGDSKAEGIDPRASLGHRCRFLPGWGKIRLG